MRKLNYFPLIVLALVSLLLDYYVFGGVVTLAAASASSSAIQFSYWIASIAILFSFLYMLSRVFPARKFSLIFNVSFNSYLTVFVSKLVFAVLLLGEDIYRLLFTAVNLVFGESGGMPGRSLLLSQIAMFAAAIPFFSFLFGVTFGKYYYRVRRSVIYADDLPEEFHLTFSGHTHGMQFGIEIGRFKWSPAKYRYQNWAGLAEHQGRYLYVNRGFGFLGFAGRVGIWPEITVIELKRRS